MRSVLKDVAAIDGTSVLGGFWKGWTWTTRWWFWTNPFGKYHIRQLWKMFPNSRGWKFKKMFELPPPPRQKLDGILGINTLHHFAKDSDLWSFLIPESWCIGSLYDAIAHSIGVAKKKNNTWFRRLLSSYLPPISMTQIDVSNVRRSWVFIENSLVKSWLCLFLNFCSPHGAAKLWSLFSLSSKMAHRKKKWWWS